jgi:HEAT repeat protein
MFPSNSNDVGRGRAGAALLLAGLLILSAALVSRGAPVSSRPQESVGAPAPALDVLLKDLAGFKNGGSEEVLHAFRAYARAHRATAEERATLEARLDAFLEGEVTPAGRMAACRELRLIGTEASVPVLAKLLPDPESTDAARYALEKIPGAAADAALIKALTETSGPVQLGLISSLGGRRCAAAVPDLAEIVLRGDSESGAAAATAIGAIGGDVALKSLSNLLTISGGEVRSRIASALLLCGEEFLKQKDEASAAAAYDRVFQAKVAEPLRLAAFRGKIRVSGSGAETDILAALAGRDAGLREAALDLVPDVFGPDSIGRAADLFPKLPAASKVHLLAILSGYPKDSALPAVVKAAGDPEAAVRIQALKALEKVGDGSVVPILAERAARARGAEQLAARSSLWGLKGADVDQAVIALLAAAPDEAVKAAAVRAVGERSIGAGKDALFGILRGGPASLRLEAIRGLKGLAEPSDLPVLLGLLLGLRDDAEQEEMRSLIAGVSLTIVRTNARADAVKSLYAATTDVAGRGSLLRVLGRIGEDGSLPVIRKAMAEGNSGLTDAAVRALCDWPTATARDDLKMIAGTSSDPVHKVLALQAFVRMVGLEPYRNPAAATADLETALALASRPEEKKLVLGLLPRFACPQSLALAQSLLADPGVKAEAEIAVAAIKERLGANT